jgi:hypothetical protein
MPQNLRALLLLAHLLSGAAHQAFPKEKAANQLFIEMIFRDDR